jgi:hypothetical protein
MLVYSSSVRISHESLCRRKKCFIGWDTLGSIFISTFDYKVLSFLKVFVLIHMVKTLRASPTALLWTGSKVRSAIFVAESYATSPYLRLNNMTI